MYEWFQKVKGGFSFVAFSRRSFAVQMAVRTKQWDKMLSKVVFFQLIIRMLLQKRPAQLCILALWGLGGHISIRFLSWTKKSFCLSDIQLIHVICFPLERYSNFQQNATTLLTTNIRILAIFIFTNNCFNYAA